MTIEEAQRAAELLQKIKVAKIQKNNFEKFTVDGGGVMLWGKENDKFSVGEDIEKGNWILINTMKEAAIKYLDGYISELEKKLNEM